VLLRPEQLATGPQGQSTPYCTLSSSDKSDEANLPEEEKSENSVSRMGDSALAVIDGNWGKRTFVGEKAFQCKT